MGLFHLSAFIFSPSLYVEEVRGLNREQVFKTDSPVSCIAFSPDGKVLAGGDDAGNIYLWDMLDGKLLLREKMHEQGVNDIIFSPGGSMLVSVGNDFLINRWTLPDRKFLDSIGGFVGWVQVISFSSAGDELITVHGNGQIRRWRVSDGTILSLTSENFPVGGFSQDGSLLSLGFGDGRVRVLRNEDWSVLINLANSQFPVVNLSFSPDTALLAITYRKNTGNEIQFWDINDGTRLFMLPGYRLLFTPDQRLFAILTTEGEIQIWGIPPK